MQRELAAAAWAAFTIALTALLAGCAGAPAQSATTDAAPSASAPAAWRPPAGSRALSYGCGQSGAHLGSGDYASGFMVDLDAGLWGWSFMDGPTTHNEGPQPVPAPALVEIRRLAEEVLADPSGWLQESARMDGAACSLVIEVSGSTRPLASVQRQTQTRDDAPDLLIRQIMALRARGLQP